MTRDFAKIGPLYLNNGNWNGVQIVPEEPVTESTKIDTTEGSASRHQYQWWMGPGENDYYAQGILKQFIYVNPDTPILSKCGSEKNTDILAELR